MLIRLIRILIHGTQSALSSSIGVPSFVALVGLMNVQCQVWLNGGQVYFALNSTYTYLPYVQQIRHFQ